MNGPADVTGVITNNLFAGASVAAIHATNARGLVILNNTLETATVPVVLTVGNRARSVWVQDLNGAAYYAGPSSPQPTFRLGGRLQFGGATSSSPALKGNGASLETRLADDSGYAQHTALAFKQSSGPSWTSGSGAPAGACVPGSLYSRVDGGAKSTLYVCERSAWVAK
jgi:hypothetical protein